ncbi:hypothetical protein DFH27DRAFT_648539 [Peziza echinospora]|nr:hypothetical protein DFH27DRAFT_648539 [Peziza echinospora]
MPPIPLTKRPTPPSLTLYIDIVSPFSYIAFHVLTHSPHLFTTSPPSPTSDRNLTHVAILPCSLHHVMTITNGLPPAKSCPLKSKYIWKDMRRQAKRWGVPVLSEEEGLPEGFPFDKRFIHLQNLAYHIHKLYPHELFLATIDLLFHLIWTPSPPPSFGSARADVHALPEATEILQKLKFPKPEIDKILLAVRKEEGGGGSVEEGKVEVSPKLKEATMKIVEETECFGLPWFVATNKNNETDVWWGSDQLGVIAEFLGVSWPEGKAAGTDSERIWQRITK